MIMQSCVTCDCRDARPATPAGVAGAIEAEVEALANVVEAFVAAEVDVCSDHLVFWSADVAGRLAGRTVMIGGG